MIVFFYVTIFLCFLLHLLEMKFHEIVDALFGEWMNYDCWPFRNICVCVCVWGDVMNENWPIWFFWSLLTLLITKSNNKRKNFVFVVKMSNCWDFSFTTKPRDDKFLPFFLYRFLCVFCTLNYFHFIYKNSIETKKKKLVVIVNSFSL